MAEQLNKKSLTEDDIKRLQEIANNLWKRMRFYPRFNMDGEFIGGETIITEEIENLADKPKKELPSKTDTN